MLSYIYKCERPKGNTLSLYLLVLFVIIDNMLKLIEKELQLETLEHLYSNVEDLRLAWTKAMLPFNREQWIEWFKESKERKAYSLYLEKDGATIGHSAVLKYKSGPELSYMCFLIIDQELRGKGYGKELTRLTCDFVRQKIPSKEVYLMVSPENIPAYSCYLNSGFHYVDGTDPKRFKKLL